MWGRNWRVVILPSILTIAGTAFSVLSDIAQINIAIEDIHSKTNKCFASNKFFTNTGTIYLALSFGTTLVVTTTIIWRIVKVDAMKGVFNGGSGDGSPRRLGLGLGSGLGSNSGRASRLSLPRLTGAVEILVESSMIYAISILSLFILLIKGSPRFMFAQAVVAQITVRSPTHSPCVYPDALHRDWHPL